MKTLETNDWIILNTIIYKVYTLEDFDEMRKELLEQLKLLVDFDSADFYLASAGDEKKLDRPVMYNCDSNLSELYEQLDYSRGIMLSGKSLIYRETDIISDESPNIIRKYTNRTTGIIPCRLSLQKIIIFWGRSHFTVP